MNQLTQERVMQSPVSWETIDSRMDRLIGDHHNAVVDLFLEYKDRPLEGGGTVTRKAFEEKYNLAHRTFGDWLAARGETRPYRKPLIDPPGPDPDGDRGWDLPGVDPDVKKRLMEIGKANEEALARTCTHCPMHGCPEQ